ncbi:MAG: AAA family ATPase, partial [Bacteroidales bacterium]|nr:AAA family ATPase [Bacteroidales bacterium]
MNILLCKEKYVSLQSKYFKVMDSIIKSYNRVIERVDDKFNRYMYSKIAWNDRMIGIKGPRGVGKTTLLLQHIKEAFPDRSKALYATLDNIWFSKHTLTELVEYHYTHGGTHIFLDEVHRYRLFPWAQELKNVYDSYPDMHIVFTGSSLLELDNSVADLSRRCRMYEMYGLSFREYIKMVEGLDLDVLCLDDVLSKHTQIAAAISKKIKVLPLFEKYLRCGFFPFFGDMDEEGYYARISQIITTIIENDI